MAGKPGYDPGRVLDPKDLQAFQTLGLSFTAAAAYQHILFAAEWSVEGLADALGVSRSTCAAALDELVARALIVPSQEAGDSLRPVAPRVGLTPLLRQQDRHLRHLQDELDRGRSSLEQLANAFDVRDTARRASLEQVFGRDQIADRVADLIQHAETEVLTLLTLLPSAAALQHARRSDEALLERGVHTRLIVLAGHLRRSREFADHLKLLLAKGAGIRVVPTAPTRMIIVDRKAAIVPANPEDPGSAVAIIHQPGLIRLTIDAFETAWNIGSLLCETSAPASDEWTPSDLEREIIRLLGEGNKDEAIARRVGLSLRSVRRLISNLSAQLGADSRFALGVLCKRRNLVS